MQLINLQTKQPESFDNLDDAAANIANGSYGVYGDDIYPVYDPQGAATKIKGDDLQRALQEGWSLKPTTMNDPITNEAEADHYDKLNAQAAVTGALRGLTFGMSDQFLTKMYGLSPDHLRKLRQYNSVVSGVSEIGGAIAPIIASGGTGLVGRAAAKTLPGLMSKVGAFTTAKAAAGLGRVTGTAAAESGIAKYVTGLTAKGIGSAIEGAAYGAGEFVTEDALKDPEMQGQSLMAHMGEGALGGAVFGTLIPGGIDAFGVVRRKIPSMFDWAAKTTRVFSGIKPDIIEAYMKEPMKYAGQISNEEIAEQLTGRFKHFDDLVTSGNIELEKARTTLDTFKRDYLNYSKELPEMVESTKKIIDDGLEIMREDIKKANISPELIDETHTLIKGLRERRNELSQESYQILGNYSNPEGYSLNIDDFIRAIKSFPKNNDKYKMFYKGGKSSPLLSTQKNFVKLQDDIINDFRNFKKTYSNNLSFPEIKKLVQLIDQRLDDAPWGEMGTMEQELLKDSRSYLGEKLNFVFDPITNESFQDKMFAVQDTVEIYNYLRNRFLGKNIKDISPIKKRFFEILKDDKKPNLNDDLRALLDADGWVADKYKYTEDLNDRLTGMKADRSFAKNKGVNKKTIEEARIGQSPELSTLLKKYQDLLIDQDSLDKVKGRRYPEELKKAIEEKLFGKVELRDDIAMQEFNMKYMQAGQAGTEAQRKVFEPYKDYFKTIPKVMTASHQSPEKIRALFHDASRLSDTDFVQLVEQLRVQTAFDNAFVNGSRNVNLYSRIGSSLLSPATGGGAVGGGFLGGPMGAAVGAMFGGIVDFFGPAIAKKVLFNLSTLKNKFTPKDYRESIIKALPASSRNYLDNHVKILGRVERDTNKTINLVGTSLSDYVTRPASAMAVGGTKMFTDDREFENLKAQTQEYIDNRDAVNSTFYDDHQNIGDIIPKTMDSYFATYNRAIDFLDSKLPKTSPTDIFGDKKPNRIEMAKFATYLRYVKKPFDLLEEMKSGNISQEGVEVYKYVYPDIYNNLVEQITAKLSDTETAKKIPMEKRLQLKRVFGLNFYPQFDYRTFSNMQTSNSVKEQQHADEKQAMNKMVSRQGRRSQTDLNRIMNKQA